MRELLEDVDRAFYTWNTQEKLADNNVLNFRKIGSVVRETKHVTEMA